MKMIIKNPSQIVTCSSFDGKKGSKMQELNVLTDSSLVIEDGIIKDIDKTNIILDKYNLDEYEIVDATNKALLPGFVDSHTHFVFGGYREEEFSWRLRGDSYMDIMQRGGGIVSSVKSTKEEDFNTLYNSAKKRLDSMLSFGVTTVEGKSGYGLDMDTEIKQLEVMKKLNEDHVLDIATTFLGPHALPKEYNKDEMKFIDFMIEKVLPKVKEENLAEFADIFCEKNVFEIESSRKYLNAAKEMGFKLKLHADEIVRIEGAKLAGEVKATSADHLLQASDEGIKSLVDNDVVCTLLPMTAFSLKEDYARARYMIDNGACVALATDLNPGSCFTNSIPLMISLATIYMNMSIEETINALTINAAKAVSREKEVGSIDVGKKADMIILEFPSYKFLSYHIGVNIVEKVIKSGKLVFDKTKGGILC